MKLMIFIVALAAAIGLILLLVGAIGVRSQRSRSYCRRCGQESHRHSTRCTECGRNLVLDSRFLARALNNPWIASLVSPIRCGKRVPRPRFIAIGSLALTLSLAAVAALIWSDARGFDWYRVRTTNSLLGEISRERTPLSTLAFRELSRRAGLNQLTRAELIALATAVIEPGSLTSQNTQSTFSTTAARSNWRAASALTPSEQSPPTPKQISGTTALSPNSARTPGASEENLVPSSALSATLAPTSSIALSTEPIDQAHPDAPSQTGRIEPSARQLPRMPQASPTPATEFGRGSERLVGLESSVRTGSDWKSEVAPEYRFSQFSLVSGPNEFSTGFLATHFNIESGSLVPNQPPKNPVAHIRTSPLGAPPLGPGWSPSGNPLPGQLAGRGARIPGKRF